MAGWAFDFRQLLNQVKIDLGVGLIRAEDVMLQLSVVQNTIGIEMVSLLAPQIRVAIEVGQFTSIWPLNYLKLFDQA